MSKISREGSRVIIHVSVRPKQKKRNQQFDNYPLSIPHNLEYKKKIETSDLSVNTIYVNHKRDPFSTLVEATKYRKRSPKKTRRGRYGFYPWLLCVLCCCLMAVLAILAALLLSLSQKNQEQPTSTSTVTTTTTTETTTSQTTTSTTTKTTTSTTSQTTTTTTTHQDCLSLNILNGTAFNGYDIIAYSVPTYVECCERCFVTPTCAVFTLRFPAGGGGCFLKNSTAGGTGACPYCISASI